MTGASDASFDYDFVRGHIVFCIDDRIALLDTGAPVSVGTDSLRFTGRDFPLQTHYMGMTVADISELAGVAFDVLMGVDMLGDIDLDINPANNLICFEHGLSMGGLVLSIDRFMGIPIISCTAGGSPIRAFFDTGAPLSYVAPELVEGRETVGHRKDFYPGFGRFESDVYHLDVTFGPECVTLEVGVLPPLLGTSLAMANTSGIIGTGLLEHYRCGLSLARGQLALQARTS